MAVYLDTETTGLTPADEIVEIAVVGENGKPLLHTLVRPERATCWPDAEAIHGITPAMVEGAPTLDQIRPKLAAALWGHDLVIYNAAYDRQYLPPEALAGVTAVHCAMLRYAEHRQEWDHHRGRWRWHRLADAARLSGHRWTSTPHRALADALACRHVWLWLDGRS